MVKKVAVIALDPRASAFYGKQVQELFGEYVKVNSYSVREGTISNMERADPVSYTHLMGETIGEI